MGVRAAIELLPSLGDRKWLVCWAWKEHVGEECWPRGLCPWEGIVVCVLVRSVRLERGYAEADGVNLLCDSQCAVLLFLICCHFDFQAALLKNDETKALTPASLQKELNNLLKFNPDFAEAVSFFQNLLLGCKERPLLFNISDRHTNSRF